MATTYLEAPEDDAISLTLAKYKPQELLDVIKGLKQIIDADPQQGRAMLEANADLTYAILQAEFLMGLVDDAVVSDAMSASHIGTAQTNVQSTEAPAPPDPANGSGSVTPAPAPAAKDPFEGMDPQQAEMIKQVLTIPDDQIQLLPPEQREMVLNLKKTYGS